MVAYAGNFLQFCIEKSNYVEMATKKVLIIGAGGFIGGFMAQESLQRGYETWVAVRKSTSRKYLSDERLNFVVL